MKPLLLINTVGLTGRLLAHAPRLKALADQGWQRPLTETLPAVTCTAQATMLTGSTPQEHGIVGNGWLFRDTMEVRFWQQSNRLLEREPIYQTAKRSFADSGKNFRCAKVFWWFNQGAQVDISVTPKPHYGADGNKAFDIAGTPAGLTERLKHQLGNFPFPAFWGPMAGLPSTEWIAQCGAEILRSEGPPPDLTLVYLPHLDYEPQRVGPQKCDWKKLVGELDRACAPLLDAAQSVGARVWVTNEYTHVQVDMPIEINRALRKAGWLTVRPGPFGETMDLFGSRAFAVCDHQLAHVYVASPADVKAVRECLQGLTGIGQTFAGEERQTVALDHPRSGEIVALAKPNAWFAYPFWLEDRQAPDYARAVDIHRKPGYDPCELFFDPALCCPKLKAMGRFIQKKMGFRTLFDVIPLDAKLVQGSHGLQMPEPWDRPVLIGDGPVPGVQVKQSQIKELLMSEW